MDRYSPPTNYWVNIKYQIRKSRSKLRLYSKSAILRAQQLFSSWCHQTLEVIVPVGILSSSIKQTKLHVSIVIAKKNWIWLVKSQSWTFRQFCVLKRTPIQFCSCMFLLKPWRMTSENRRASEFVVEFSINFFHQAQSHKQLLNSWPGWQGTFAQGRGRLNREFPDQIISENTHEHFCCLLH